MFRHIMGVASVTHCDSVIAEKFSTEVFGRIAVAYLLGTVLPRAQRTNDYDYLEIASP